MEEELAVTIRPLLVINDELDNDDDQQCNVTFMLVLSTLVAVCGSYVFGNALGYSSSAETGIVDDFNLTTAEYSVFASILTIGAMLGAILSGKIADLIGRRGAMGVADIFCCIGWLAIVLSKNVWWLDIGRFLVGCGIGLLSFAVPVYVAEITPKNVRGRFVSLVQLMIGVGKALFFLIGSLVNWRALAIIGLIPCVIQFLCLFFVPETPRWLVKIGRFEEFEDSLQRLRGKNADISREATDIKDYTDYLERISAKDGFLSLFQQKYSRSIIIVVGLMIFKELGGIDGFTFYASNLFKSAGFSITVGNIVAAIVQITMCVLGVLFVDHSGRRPLLLISASGTCLGCVITGLSFFLQDLHSGKELIPILVLLGVSVFLGFFEFGMGGIPWTIMSEILPMNIKDSGGSLVNFVSWFGSWFVAYTFNFLFEWSHAGTFLIYAGICGVGVLSIAKLVPETKGRTLEEIQASILSATGN
ncbi:hypothetical protein ACOSQ2_015203 [Xanthoceras sorbifolium]